MGRLSCIQVETSEAKKLRITYDTLDNQRLRTTFLVVTTPNTGGKPDFMVIKFDVSPPTEQYPIKYQWNYFVLCGDSTVNSDSNQFIINLNSVWSRVNIITMDSKTSKLFKYDPIE